MEWFSVSSFILFFIGTLAAIIGVMFGAAGFVLLPAMLLIGIPIHTTVAVNKFATGVSSLSTVVMLIVKKKIHLRFMLPSMLSAAIGGITGAFITTRLSEQTMNVIACIVLIIAFFYVIKRNQRKLSIHTQQEQPPKLLPSFFISIYDGGIGPGSALMNITYFLNKQFSYVKAVEMTRFVMFASCISAFIFYYFSGVFNWGIAIPVTLGCIVGSHIGLKIVPYLKSKWIQLLLPVIFLILISQIIVELF